MLRLVKALKGSRLWLTLQKQKQTGQWRGIAYLQWSTQMKNLDQNNSCYILEQYSLNICEQTCQWCQLWCQSYLPLRAWKSPCWIAPVLEGVFHHIPLFISSTGPTASRSHQSTIASDWSATPKLHTLYMCILINGSQPVEWHFLVFSNYIYASFIPSVMSLSVS